MNILLQIYEKILKRVNKKQKNQPKHAKKSTAFMIIRFQLRHKDSKNQKKCKIIEAFFMNKTCCTWWEKERKGWSGSINGVLMLSKRRIDPLKTPF